MVVITDILVDARRGGGAPAEILFGTVTFKPTLAHQRGTSIVLPAPTTFDLVNGTVVATNIQPTPAPVGGKIEWGYEVTFKDRHSKTYSFLVGVPDSTTQLNFAALPRYFETEPPLFGQGPKGDPGEAATIAIGAVSSGSVPTVTNSGTNKDAVLNFTLPKGDKGDRGEPGTGVVTSQTAPKGQLTYKWTSTPNESSSVELLDNVVQRTNFSDNPSYETGSTSKGITVGSTATVSIDTQNSFVGKQSLKVVDGAGTNRYAGQHFNIPAGTAYLKFTFALKHVSGDNFARIRVGYRDSPTTGNFTYTPFLASEALTSAWKTFSLGTVIPATSQTIQILVYGTNGLTSADTTGYSLLQDAFCVTGGTSAANTPEATYFDGSSDWKTSWWLDPTTNKLSVWDGTKWTSVDKTSVGLGNVDNTSDANKPVSTATQAAIDNKGLLAYQSKTFNDAPSTYPKGESNGLFRVSAGWPELTVNAQFAHVITYVHSLNYGGTVQYMYPYSSAPSANYAYRVANAAGEWGELRYGVTEDKIAGYRATERNTFAGLYSGQNNDGMYPLDPNVNGGYELVGIGRGALQMNQRGWKNTAIGYDAMRDNIDGYMNVAVGNSALERTTGGIGMGTPTGNAPGSRNTAVGSNAGRYNTTGKQNTYIGRDAGHSALTGDGNTAVGAYAWTGIVDGDIHSSKTGNYNTALGYGAGYFNDSDYNVAVGYMSLEKSINKDSYGNVAIGSQALRNSEARENTGLGNEAGKNVTDGRFSIAIGPRALGANSTAVTGYSNISIGAASSPALESGAFNIALGQEALTPITSGSGNVAIGHRATISAAASISYGVAVGYQANAGHNRSVALGSSAATTSASQVQLGDRHMELNPITSPAAPTGAVRLYYVTVGGKGQLRARFPTGAEQVISQEP